MGASKKHHFSSISWSSSIPSTSVLLLGMPAFSVSSELPSPPASHSNNIYVYHSQNMLAKCIFHAIVLSDLAEKSEIVTFDILDLALALGDFSSISASRSSSLSLASRFFSK